MTLSPTPPATRDELDELLNQAFGGWRRLVERDEDAPDFGPYLRRRLAEHGVTLVPTNARVFPLASPYYTEAG